MQGQWQLESPAREYLEQVHCCLDTDCFIALKSGEREEYKNTFRKEVKATECAFDRIREAFEKVAQDEASKLSTVLDIMLRSTNNLRRTHHRASGRRQGGVTMSYLCPHCNSFPMEDYVWWVSGRKKHRKRVVRDLWRVKRLEATRQASCGANRQKC